ncbi:MAG TPA: NAD(P)-dependent oxidoreductase [Polyangia bacterium]
MTAATTARGGLTIVGGAGFLGRSLVARLAAAPEWAGREVCCLDRVPLPPGLPRPARLREVVAPVEDAAALAAAVAGADAVFVRAAVLGGARSTDVANLRGYLDGNVALCERVLGAAAAAGCRRVLFDSSEQVFGDPADAGPQTPAAEPVAASYYAATKLIAEQRLRLWAAGPDEPPRSVQVFRYSRVRAAETKDVIRAMVAAALQDRPLRILGNSTRRISFVHVDDVVAANLVALGRAPRFALYHVAADRPVSLFELALRVREAARQRTGASPPILVEPAAGARPFEPHVVGLQWEPSLRELGLPAPRGLDEMIAETIAAVAGAAP